MHFKSLHFQNILLCNKPTILANWTFASRAS